jgi:phosphoribosylanthranilate isomerase
MLEFDSEVAVKVCGITNIEDALDCAAAEVEMIGLNFSPASPRRIAATTAGEIIAAARTQFPGIKIVGGVVDQDLEFVRQLAREFRLDAVQLHGEETPEYVRDLNAPFVIKALRIRPDSSTSPAANYHCDAILLDTWSAKLPGGTGETFPWSVAAALQFHAKKLILAGGLTNENVADAIRTVRPFAVDVCSGVEVAPGRKDHARVRRFVEAVRAAIEVKAAR